MVAEVDGARHHDAWESEAGDVRQNELVAGHGQLRFSSYRVRHEPDQVGDVSAASWSPPDGAPSITRDGREIPAV